MAFNTIPRPSVGADLSRPPPIYRPIMANDAHDWIPYATPIIGPVRCWAHQSPTSVLQALHEPFFFQLNEMGLHSPRCYSMQLRVYILVNQRNYLRDGRTRG